MFEDGIWTGHGIYGGRLIDKAYEALANVHLTASLSIEVLDSVCGDDRLEITLTSNAFIDDMTKGRTGVEWHLERSAIAKQNTQDLKDNWFTMRERIRENYIVSLCSATEHFIKTMLAEFPISSENNHSDNPGTYDDIEGSRLKIDIAYRKLMKSTKSAAKTWIALCTDSSIPLSAKRDLADWGTTKYARDVDELVLVRNDLVHRAGDASSALAGRLGIEPGAPVKISEANMKRYGRACSKNGAL